MKKKTKTNSDQLLIAFMLGAFRSAIEDLHSGVTPSSKTGDYSDVKVVTPYGEIPWNKLSRISDKEIGELKDEIRILMYEQLNLLKENGFKLKASNELIKCFDIIKKNV